MIKNFAFPMQTLSYIPDQLTELIYQQLILDGESISQEICEQRLSAARQMWSNAVLFCTLEDNGFSENAPASELINNAKLRAFAFSNINYGLECGGCYLWLNELHVEKHSRRRGMGKALLNYIDEWARKNEVVYIACLTGSDNSEAQSMYAKNGYSLRSVTWVEKSIMEPSD